MADVAVSVVRRERGSAVVDFVLIVVLLIPLLLGVVDLALVLHVRNTTAAAASDGARAAAAVGAGPAVGIARTRQLIATAIADRYAEDVSAANVLLDGLPAVVVRVRARVPALGPWGPAVAIEVRGHAIRELRP